VPDVLKTAYLRATAVDYLKHFIGLPYIWGGDDPMTGFDCSGLIVEVLQAVGLLKHGTDYSAAMLYKKFEDGAVDKGYAGCLVFWYRDEDIIHIEMMIDDFHTIGASGGGSTTTTINEAIKANAFVKQRPLSYRGTNYLISDPFKVEGE
jgi:cell wall-associated NlpC family hydrolase